MSFWQTNHLFAESLLGAPTNADRQLRSLGILKGETDTELSGKRNPDGGTRTEEISERAFGYLQLLQSGDGRGLGTACICANAGDIGDALRIWRHLGRRNRELRDVDRVVRAGIIAVKDIEEFNEGNQ